MLTEQKSRLESMAGGTLSIGISAGGQPRKSIGVPWKHTGNAYNMRTPDLWLAPEDLRDPTVEEKLKASSVIGCYSFVPLGDYSFLSKFPDLQDLRLRGNKARMDLSFLESLKDWFLLYIEDAQLEDLSPAFPENWRDKGLHSYCVGFVGCDVTSLEPMVRDEIYLSELLVCQPEGTGDKSRWKAVRAGTYRYFEYKEGKE